MTTEIAINISSGLDYDMICTSGMLDELYNKLNRCNSTIYKDLDQDQVILRLDMIYPSYDDSINDIIDREFPEYIFETLIELGIINTYDVDLNLIKNIKPLHIFIDMDAGCVSC